MIFQVAGFCDFRVQIYSKASMHHSFLFSSVSELLGTSPMDLQIWGMYFATELNCLSLYSLYWLSLFVGYCEWCWKKSWKCAFVFNMLISFPLDIPGSKIEILSSMVVIVMCIPPNHIKKTHVLSCAQKLSEITWFCCFTDYWIMCWKNYFKKYTLVESLWKLLHWLLKNVSIVISLHVVWLQSGT